MWSEDSGEPDSHAEKPPLTASSYWVTLRPATPSYLVFAKHMKNVPRACRVGTRPMEGKAQAPGHCTRGRCRGSRACLRCCEQFAMKLTQRPPLRSPAAGISAESGLATFRGSGGLWDWHRVEEVATAEAWHANRELVWRFYSMRRGDAMAVEPNAALALANIERKLGNHFYLCTQNVDDLHERAGTLRLHHMHGTLFQSRCVECNVPFPDESFYETAADLPVCTKCGAPIRPHIVWFGEIPLDMEGIYAELDRATRLLVVGTSGSVYPARDWYTSPTSAVSVPPTWVRRNRSTPTPSKRSFSDRQQKYFREFSSSPTASLASGSRSVYSQLAWPRQ